VDGIEGKRPEKNLGRTENLRLLEGSASFFEYLPLRRKIEGNHNGSKGGMENGNNQNQASSLRKEEATKILDHPGPEKWGKKKNAATQGVHLGLQGKIPKSEKIRLLS